MNPEEFVQFANSHFESEIYYKIIHEHLVRFSITVDTETEDGDTLIHVDDFPYYMSLEDEIIYDESTKFSVKYGDLVNYLETYKFKFDNEHLDPEILALLYLMYVAEKEGVSKIQNKILLDKLDYTEVTPETFL